jgi:hypothetical protein
MTPTTKERTGDCPARDRDAPPRTRRYPMPGSVSDSYPGLPDDAPYVPSSCYQKGPRMCPCRHHEGCHADDGKLPPGTQVPVHRIATRRLMPRPARAPLAHALAGLARRA